MDQIKPCYVLLERLDDSVVRRYRPKRPKKVLREGTRRSARLAAKRPKVHEDEVKVEVNPLPPFESIVEPMSPFEELEKFLEMYDGGYEVDACLNFLLFKRTYVYGLTPPIFNLPHSVGYPL